MAHGYHGSANDFILLTNFIKYKFKKCKYLILKSYHDKMDKGLE